MEILQRIAGDLSPKASGPLEVAGEGTDLAPEDADSSDVADKAGKASLSTRYCGKRARVTKAVIAAVAVIVVCGARYIMSGRSKSYLKTSKLGVEDVSQPSLDDVPQPSLEDVSQLSLDDVSQLSLDVVSQLSLDDVPQLSLDDAPQPFLDDVSQPSLDDVTQPSLDDVSQPSLDDVPQPSLDDVPQPSLDDVSQQSLDVVSQLSLDDVSQPSLDDVTQPSLDDVSQPSLDVVSQPSLDDVPQQSLDDVPQQSLDVVSQLSLDDVPQPSLDDAQQPFLDDVSQPSLDDVTQPSLDDVSQPSLDVVSQPSLDDVPQQSLDDKYMDDFNEAAEEIEAHFSSELAVREAFQLHFTPSLEDGQSLLGDPLTVIKDHVAKMRECTVPPASSLQARLDFAQHLQLLRSICRTVALRFKDLELFNTLNQNLGVENPFLVSGSREDYSDNDNPINFQEVTTRDWTASEFLEFFGLSGGGKRRVNESLARKLKLLLDIEKRHNDTNLNARYHFTAFLQPFEGDGAFNSAHAPAEHQIPYTGNQFRTGALAEAAAHIFRESDANTNYAFIRKLNRIADNWTNEAVAAAVKQQAKENADSVQTRLKTKRELMRGLLSQGIPVDDLVMTALFLL
ncbi:uncharacterized protein EMH_0053420 [Eimeria mitis]|uniref:Uncharacterized protein n=1 Tax=Eimeria mitis TaxID=44415 RepID=U6JYU8_9EIME|nr:uncharacterized protein EMH_0053420 [Eimeria mitis]CDJ29891.1 hypothetical protein EMH_0053420 [Eimeria mitis]